MLVFLAVVWGLSALATIRLFFILNADIKPSTSEILFVAVGIIFWGPLAYIVLTGMLMKSIGPMNTMFFMARVVGFSKSSAKRIIEWKVWGQNAKGGTDA